MPDTGSEQEKVSKEGARNGGDSVTMVIATGWNPRGLEILLASAFEYLPIECPLIVVDDSKSEHERTEPTLDEHRTALIGIGEWWMLPELSGLEALKNFGASRVSTDWILFCDDEIKLPRRFEHVLARSLRVAQEHEVDILGSETEPSGMLAGKKAKDVKPCPYVHPFTQCDVVGKVILARTRLFREGLRWPDPGERDPHLGFFSAARNRNAKVGISRHLVFTVP